MEVRLKILKMMNEVTGRMDLNEFSKTIELSPKQVVEQIEELAKAGLVRRAGGGYGITEKGKTMLKAYIVVPENMEFHFYIGIGQPTGQTAKSISEFCERAEQVELASLEFHLSRGDFENWIKAAFNDLVLVEEVSKMRVAELKGEDLRKKLVNAVEARYHLEE